MKALFFDGRRMRAVTRPIPRRVRGEALVRVHMAGICATDLEILRGYQSFKGVPGHEFVGTVVSASDRSLVGMRVVGEINASCGRCELCRKGLGKHCMRRTVLGIQGRNGAFADYFLLPEANLHLVPHDLSDEEAVFTELIASASRITEQVPIAKYDRVLVIGDGRLAAMAAQIVSLENRRTAVLGKHPRKLAAIGSLGIKTLGVQQAKQLGLRNDVVIDCSGSPAGLPLAASLVRPRGTVVIKSTYQEQLCWNPAPLAVNEITVVGSRCGPIGHALSLLAQRKIAVKPFITAIYPFSRWEAALRRARRIDAFKVIMRIA